MESGPLRWLHLSDLHFKAEEKWDRRATLAALIRKVKELKEEGRGPDLVFLTGDIAFSGKKAEYDQAFAFLDQLQAATGLEMSKRFFLIPGNHDVDRGLVKKAEDRTLKAESQGEIEELLGDHEMMKRLGRRLEEFYAFTERIQGPARGWSAERPWRVDFPDVESDLGSVAVLQLNSAWASGSNNEEHLLVGEIQVREALLEAEGATLKIALVHHPIAELADSDREVLETLLPASGGIQLLLFGHLHRQRPQLVLSPSGVLAELATGATHNEDTYPRGFLFGELSPGGRLETHLYAYSKSDGGFWAPDGLAFRQAPNGVWVTNLALRGAKESVAPSAERTATATARYRQAVQQVHGIARFVGFADNRPRPNAQVAELFVPLRLETIGAKQESWTTARLLSWLAKPGKKGRPGAVLLGDPGSGKTTLSRFAAVWFAGGVKFEGATAPKKSVLPLFLPFREYVQACAKNECSLLNFLEDQAANHLQVKLPEGFLEAAIEKGDAVLLLDGMDEVGDSGARQAMRERVLAFCAQYPRLSVLITSRVAGYDEAPLPNEDRDGFRHFRLAAFNDEDLALFVHNWYAVQEPVDSGARNKGVEELAAAFQADPRVRELAKNPLLATLIALVHRFEAHLPGERAKLYELCIKTLLETWPAARKRRFDEIDEGLQRAYLEDLALRMQETRDNDSREVVIGLELLVSTLVRILLARNTEDPEVVRRRIERWIQHLDQGTGLLVEQRPGFYAFFHLSFLEYLAACALDRGVRPPLDRVVGLWGQALWREVCLLVVGRKATDKKFLDLLFERLAEQKAWDFLLGALREEADFDDSQRASILRGVGRSLLDREVYQWGESQYLLGQLKGYSLRHAEWSCGWIEEEIRSARQEDLQGVVALCYEDEGEVVEHLSQRMDGGEAAADLLDYWPNSRIGNWAADRAPFVAAFDWGRTAPAELASVRSAVACATPSPGISAGLLCRLVRSTRIGVALGAQGFARMANRKRLGGSGLPRQMVVQPGDIWIRSKPAWLAKATSISDGIPESDHLFARVFAGNFAPDFTQYFVRDFVRYFDPNFARDFVRYSARDSVWDFAGDFAQCFARDFVRNVAWNFNQYFASDVVRHFERDIDRSLSQMTPPVSSRNRMLTPVEGAECTSLERSEDQARKHFVGSLFSRLVGEAWVGLAATVDDREETRQRYLQVRVLNAWFFANWSVLDDSILNRPTGAPNLALYLALGWTQATTTHEWPGTKRWKHLLAGPPPPHWLPRTQWHLCWLLHDPKSAAHRVAFNAAIEEGRTDPELPGVTEALVEDLGWKV